VTPLIVAAPLRDQSGRYSAHSIWQKIAKCIYFTCIWRHRRGRGVGVLQRCLVLGKLEMLKKVRWCVKPFRYNTRTLQTDRRTESLYQYRTSALLYWRAIKKTGCKQTC